MLLLTVALQVDYIFRMTACLAGVIMGHPEAKGVMEGFVVTHVLPEFQSEHAYLRAVVSTKLLTKTRILPDLLLCV